MSTLRTFLTSWCDPSARPLCASFVLALLHGVTFGAAYPPFDLAWLVLVAPLPLCAIALRTERVWRSALGVMLGTAPMWWWHHQWIVDISSAGLPALVLYLSVWPALLVVIGVRLRARFSWLPAWLSLSLLWAGLEVVRGEVVFTGYPWFLLVHPLIDEARFAHASAHTGVYALSALVALPGTVLATWIVQGRLRARFGTITILVSALALSLVETPTPGTRSALVMVVQTNVPQSNRGAWTMEQRIEDYERATALMLRGMRRWPATELVIWPESMFPGFSLDPTVLRTVRENAIRTPFADDLQVISGVLEDMSLLIGAHGFDGYRFDPDAAPVETWEDQYNSVFLLESGRVVGRYDKRALMPFGEVLPYFDLWPWLERRVMALGARGMSFSLSAGSSTEALETRTALRVATPICFEATWSGVCRSMVFAPDGTRRADLLVNPTNDGWFGDHVGGRAHHALVARWRCAELRTPMVRAVNTGISTFIDATGRFVTGSFVDETGQEVSWRGERDAWGVLGGEVVLGEGDAPPTAGPVLTLALGAIAVIGALAGILPRRWIGLARLDRSEAHRST